MRPSTTRFAGVAAAVIVPAAAIASMPFASTSADRAAEPATAAAAEPLPAGPLAADTGVVAFTNVNVVPMDRERVLEDRTVLVRGERIAEMGPADDVAVPADALVVDGRGRWLVPGIAEMHAHVPGGGQSGTEFMERVLFLYLSNGITTIRGMLGAPIHLEVRERIRGGELLAPRFYTSGPSLNGNSIPSPDSARRAVLHQASAGYDFLKIHPGLSRAAYDTIDAVADRAGIRYAGHVPADVGLWRALEAGQATVDHLDQYAEAIVRDGADASGREPAIFGFHLTDLLDRSRIASVAEATRRAGVWNVPTQSLLVKMLAPADPADLAARPEMRYMPPRMVDGWADAKRRFTDAESYSPELARRYLDVRLAVIKGLYDAGAKLLLGSDAPQIFQVPGFSIRDEVRAFAEAGVPNFGILLAGTRNVAEYFGDEDVYGTVETGKVADLILVGGNPLEDIDNLFRQAGVMVRGRWLPAAEIRRRLDEIATAYDATE